MENHAVIKLNCNNLNHINNVIRLHNELLPESYVSRLGDFFMRNFYYKDLIKEKLIDAYLYEFNNILAGFIVCTVHPFDLIRLGLRKSPFKLLYVLTISFILNPMRLFTILNLLKDKLSDHVISEIGTDSGQFMSFGVLEEFRGMKNETGRTPSQELMDKVFEYFREKGKSSFFLLVLKTNLKAINFYKKYNPQVSDESAGESIIIKFRTDNA